ncbi:hypothetical protein [Pseudomonas sp. NPDC089734]|uniref:hypothetical protein n=1 Tax=Pseudomonas sp. NPDC089734 TaxID=3364469 RepID=UPI0038192A7D
MNKQTTDHLPAPSLPQLSGDGTLSLSAIHGTGVQILVPVYPGMKVGDRLSAPWEGTPGSPEFTFPIIHVVEHVREMIIKIPPSSVHAGWKKLKVRYNVKGVGHSDWVEVDITP